ncbi:MAG: exodeoxyribonuclease III [Bacillales bacterium]|nr:exodeoxyribonuclease III [Bacillales bacterium]
MKFISWNVNGLRAAITKGFYDYLSIEKPDFLAVQETKMQEDQADISSFGYHLFWNSADKKGYSGTLIYAKEKPLEVYYGINGKYSDEGRLITLEYADFYFVTIYTPNSKEALERLDYRMVFEDDLREYLLSLKEKKHVIVCGDLNVAHEEIDLKNPDSNHKNPGFSDEERAKFTALLKSGFVDTFRYLYPSVIKYSWWSYRFFARDKGIGWRIDYFLVDEGLKERVKDSIIRNDIFGSDHCPVELIIE